MLSIRSLMAAAVLLAPAAALAQGRTCKTGELFAGSPVYRPTGTEKMPATMGLTDEPPLHWRTLTFAGNTLYTNTGQEIWAADLASGKLRRVAGEQAPGAPRFSDGPCAKARFANLHGMAALPDGSLVVADHEAHALLRITSPQDPAACAVAFLAGTRKATDNVRFIRSGDKDGPGAEALIANPEWPVADGAGNIYFVDGGTGKVKQVDLENHVSTLAKLPREGGIQVFRDMTLLGGKLYTIGNTFTTGYVHEVDTRNGKVRKLATLGWEQLPEVGQNATVALSSITTDGKDLFLSSSGFIWRMSPRGGKPVHVAGAGSPNDFPKGYDPEGKHPAKQLVLRYRIGDQNNLGTNTAMTYHDGALYWRGRSDSPFVVKISCP
jgi:hypothetical protein